MAANTDTKLQVNFKLADGTLINLYATNQAELEGQIAAVRDLAQQIIGAATLLNTRSNVGAITYGYSQTEKAIQDSLGGQLVGSIPAAHQPMPEQPNSFNVRECIHGERVFRESKPGSAKIWKGYFCPSPKGTPNQCEPNFVKA